MLFSFPLLPYRRYFIVTPLPPSLYLIANIGFMGLNVDDSQECGGGPRARRDGAGEEEEIEGGAVGGERDRDLQTNLITSLQN